MQPRLAGYILSIKVCLLGQKATFFDWQICKADSSMKLGPVLGLVAGLPAPCLLTPLQASPPITHPHQPAASGPTRNIGVAAGVGGGGLPKPSGPVP